MAAGVRFQLYVKAGKDGKCLGDCPFSQRANMFARMRLNESDLQILYVDTTNKPDYFLKLNPEGKVPVMIDNKENKVIADSGDITQYIQNIAGKGSTTQNEDFLSEAAEACSGLFPKFAAMMKNKDDSKTEELKNALSNELGKLNTFLKEKKTDGKYLMGETLCELDCQILPKLKHVLVAGKKYKDFDIPAEFEALHEYLRHGQETDEFKVTCPEDEQFVWGWSKFF